jgi:hypothetical protein
MSRLVMHQATTFSYAGRRAALATLSLGSRAPNSKVLVLHGTVVRGASALPHRRSHYGVGCTRWSRHNVTLSGWVHDLTLWVPALP